MLTSFPIASVCSLSMVDDRSQARDTRADSYRTLGVRVTGERVTAYDGEGEGCDEDCV